MASDTTSEQIKTLLNVLFPEMTESDWSDHYERTFANVNDSTLRIRIYDDLTLDKMYKAFSKAEIDPSFVTLGMWYNKFCLEISNMEIGYELNFD